MMHSPTNDLSFKCFVEQNLPKWANMVIYAMLEWVMIVLIFIDGFLALLSDEFAKFFELNVPCLLCTRIDYVMSHNRWSSSSPNYNESMCEAHKKDISSLVYCHLHKKLSNIKRMCDTCLLSYATEKEGSECDNMYKSLLGIILQNKQQQQGDEKFIKKKTFDNRNKDEEEEEKEVEMWCLCCGELVRRRRGDNNNSKYYRRSGSLNNAIAPAPSPRAWRQLERVRSIVESPRIRFNELKMVPDHDSEIPEEDCITNGGGGRDDSNKLSGVQEDACKTPSFIRGNKFFGIPLTDSAQASPRLSRLPMDVILSLSSSDPIDTIEAAGDGDILGRLKKQVRLDRKSLMALYMELDEERNASAIAANNAMAMITRLQDEKAALQMEALQYQRMMEEEVEFDQEEVELMKEMLAKQEEDMKALEDELDAYRLKFGPLDDQRDENDAYVEEEEDFEIHGDEDYQELLRSHFLPSSVDVSECVSPHEEPSTTRYDHFEPAPSIDGNNNNMGESIIVSQENSHISSPSNVCSDETHLLLEEPNGSNNMHA
ncbi:unnamed protein product [Cuscuta epithymum]|uniref:GTD-binding domain-containing protein n=1 Tax=Cuscuta epithymum TaxID=186058 RepID=A0AAV0FY58_9ASTE|nr:unnamed protein product [Cuscuta epithymum]